MKVLRDKEVDELKWRELLNRSNFSSPFHTPEFYKMFYEVIGVRATVFAIEDNGKYEALIVVTIHKENGLKGFFSKRGICYGGPLISHQNQGAINLLLKEVVIFFKRKVIYFEIRNHCDYSDYQEAFEANGFIYEEHLNVQLETTNKSMDEVISSMKYNRRREIEQSMTKGAKVRIAKSESEVKELYDILEDLYRKRVKLPLNPYSFFKSLFDSAIGRVFVVVHNGHIIGGAFCVYYHEMSINTLYYVGLRNYDKKIFPTHLAIVGTIDFAIKNKLKMVDFMGAGKPDEDYGVRKYKLQFGGSLVQHGRFKIILKPFLYKIGVLGLHFIKTYSN